MNVNAIVTIPPYAPFIDDILRQDIVSGVRLNTVMPVKEPLEAVLGRINDKVQKYSKEFWIDLKCRQLRVKNYGVPPFTEIELTHNISVQTPVTAYFSDGKEWATVLAVDKNRLIMQEGPKRVVGPGESVNIPHATLCVDGYFTETDKKYIEAAAKAGVHNYMLSFVEKQEDINEMYKLDSMAKIIAKIESSRGVSYVTNDYIANDWNKNAELINEGLTNRGLATAGVATAGVTNAELANNGLMNYGLANKELVNEKLVNKGFMNKELDNTGLANVRLMAARGDLYVELLMPHNIIDAVETIIKKDPCAVAGSRIFNSLSESLTPSCQDIGDVDNLMRMGYRTLMLGDDICMQRDSVISGINLLAAMSVRYD